MDIRGPRISELDVFELDPTVNLTLNFVTAGDFDGRIVVHHRHNLVSGTDNGSDVTKDIRYHAKGEDELGQVEQECSDRTDGQLIVEVEPDAAEHDCTHRAIEKQRREKSVNGLVECLLATGRVHNVVASIESSDFGILVAEGSDSANVREGFLSHGVHLAFFTLNLTLESAHATHVEAREDNEREHTSHDRGGQKRRDVDEYNQHDDKLEHTADEHRKVRSKRVLDTLDV